MTDGGSGGWRIAVLGAGAMGGLYGARLARDPANRVAMIDPDAGRIGAIARDGLTLEAPEGRTTVRVEAATSPEGLGPRDLVIVLVKAFDTASAAASAALLAGPGTMVLTLQNGLGNIEALAKVLGPERVVGGTTSFGAVAGEGGIVELRGLGETVVGVPGGGGGPGMGRLAAALDRAGLAAKAADDIEARIWGKLAVNAGINALAGLLGVPNGALLTADWTRRLMEAAVGEAVEAAAGAGVGLDFRAVHARTLEICRLTAANICSTLQDLRRGRRTEIDFINGAVVEAAARASVPAPVNRLLASMIRAKESGAGRA
jgi:2-dehydropantoate 2-reductase